MREVHIVANVKPTTNDVCVYRLYINDDLITERTYTWGNNTYISENIFAKLDERNVHSINVEQVELDPLVGKRNYFKISEILINGVPTKLINNLFQVP